MNFFENQNHFSHGVNESLLFQPDEAFMLGNLFQDLYQSYKGFSNYYFQPSNKRQQMLLNVQINEFVAHEINLYLDNHPNNQNMIRLYHEFIDRADKAKKEYEMNFGPLNVRDSNCNTPFQWIEGPWPWQHQI